MFTDYRHMVFVDGENFAIRGQEYAKRRKVRLEEGEYWQPDVFLWTPWDYGDHPQYAWDGEFMELSRRAYYYTAIPGGNARTLKKTRLALRALNFEPVVFLKRKGGEKSKGVDVTMTTALVSHAYQDDYDVAFLVCGDGDYVPVVEEIKRAGKRVVVAFFGERFGLNTDLQVAADRYIDIGDYFTNKWRDYLEHRARQREASERRAKLQERAAKDQAAIDTA